jgi:hypothetical protein
MYDKQDRIKNQRASMTERQPAALATNLQNAVQWIGKTMKSQPKKQRNLVINEAQLRFDLTPAECEFLNHNFNKLTDE